MLTPEQERKVVDMLLRITLDAEDFTRRTGKVVSWAEEARQILEEVTEGD